MTLVVLLLIIFGAVFLAAWLTQKFGFRNVTYQLAFSQDEANEGDTVILTETIVSAKLLPLPWVKAELTAPAALQFATDQSAVSEDTRFVSSFFCLMPYRKIERRWNVLCAQRGVFEVSHAILCISDLFASAEHSKPFPEARAGIRVLPKPAETEQIRQIPRFLTGNVIRRRTLIPDRFAFCGIRPYMDGDPVRDISFTATARAGEPMVRQFQETASPSLTVLLCMEMRPTDTMQSSDRARLEDAVRVCAGVIAQMTAAKIPVRFGANADCGGAPLLTASGTGDAHLLSMLRVLAGMPHQIVMPFRRFFRQVTADCADGILIVTPRTDAEIQALAAQDSRCSILNVK